MKPEEANESPEVRALRLRCADVERELLFAKVGTAEAIASVMPGGLQNPDTSFTGWIAALEKLVRMQMQAAPKTSENTKDGASIDEVLGASLAGTPVVVECTDGQPRTVYPKSYHALKWLDNLDAIVQLRTQIASATRHEDSTVLEHRVATLVPLVEALAVRIWLWILTHEQPSIPFSENDENPEPPEWTLSVSPEDLVRFVRAHHEVNGRRLGALSAAFPADPTPNTGKMSLAGFIGSFSHEKGINPTDVMRQWSLGAVFASAISASRSAKLAREAAERRSKH